MNKINLFYSKGSKYESLNRRANKNKNSAFLKVEHFTSYYEVLYHIKFNNYKVKGLPSYDEVLIKVKKNLNDSIRKLRKRVNETEIKEVLEVIQIQIPNTNELNQIENLIKKALDLTFNYKTLKFNPLLIWI